MASFVLFRVDLRDGSGTCSGMVFTKILQSLNSSNALFIVLMTLATAMEISIGHLYPQCDGRHGLLLHIYIHSSYSVLYLRVNH